ncbi:MULTISPECIES: YchJ family metal-binding protein [unclassified Mycolicibacterium]|uniref:YchJ family protein n=2 Tax=unclassified Mycolicibacterium TaxID=2636767 RepID=UPI0021114F5B|nr:YchJ family metal-binding protein [Mycolicibacterium sp. YH-1]
MNCPCGSGAGYDVCCEPLHDGRRDAATAEELMRSRYAAYARGDADYVFRTWHPRTRPTDVSIDADIVWRGLEVTDTAAGGVDDDRGEVEFTAHYEVDGRAAAMHERSQFERRAGRWFYTDGDVDA